MANKKVANEYNLSILFVPLQPKSRVSQSCVSRLASTEQLIN